MPDFMVGFWNGDSGTRPVSKIQRRCKFESLVALGKMVPTKIALGIPIQPYFVSFNVTNCLCCSSAFLF